VEEKNSLMQELRPKTLSSGLESGDKNVGNFVGTFLALRELRVRKSRVEDQVDVVSVRKFVTSFFWWQTS